MWKILLTVILISAGLGQFLHVHNADPKIIFTYSFSGQVASPSANLSGRETSGRVDGNEENKSSSVSGRPANESLGSKIVAFVAKIEPDQKDVANKVAAIFVEEPNTAIAVFRAESGLRVDAQGWNCYYYDKRGKRYSAACEKADRPNAWSVDCGVAQLNFPGTECPAEAFNADWNIKQAKEKYDHRGWQPWVAHANGRYLAFL